MKPLSIDHPWRSVRVVTAPALEPVTTAQCKLDARVDGNEEDTLFESWITAARLRVESAARRALISRTLEASFDGFPGSREFLLPFPPLVSVTAITYYDNDNVQQSVPVADYIVIADEEPGRVVLATGAAWPDDLHEYARVRVRFVAGYGTAATDVPAEYRDCVRVLVTIMHQYRSEMTADGERRMTQALAYAMRDYGL